MKRIIFIETSDIGATYTAKACRKLGYEPLFLCDLGKIQGDTRLQLENERFNNNVIQCDTTTVDSMRSALETQNISKEHIIGVMTFLDSRLELAHELGKEIGAPQLLDEAIIRLKSKATVQQLIPEFSPPSFAFQITSIPLQKIQDFIERYQKVIIKPIKLAGAIGAKIFDSCNYLEIEKFLDLQNLPTFLTDELWICQAFLDGPLYSIEGFVQNGTTTFLGISNRKKVGFTESQLEFPANNNLNEKIHQSCQSAVLHLVERSKFLNGFFHIEFIVVKDSAYIIDANMGRLGGGPLGEMIPMALGVEIEDFYSFVIERTLFPHSNTIDINLNFKHETIGICYGSPSGGYFSNLDVITTPNFKHTSVLNTQQYIEAMGNNNWSWVGIISSYKNNFETDISAVRLAIDNKQVPLCY